MSLLTGKSVVFTGTLLNLTRTAAQAKAIAAGATVEKSVSKTVTLVVKGCDVDESNKKLARAVSQGVEVISEQGFFERLGLQEPTQGFDIEAIDKEKNRKRIWRTEPKHIRDARKAERVASLAQKRALRQARLQARDGSGDHELPPTQESDDHTPPAPSRGPTIPLPISRPKRSLVSFANKTFVFLGTLAQLNRLATVTLTLKNGASVSGNLTKKTHFVVVGDDVDFRTRSEISVSFPQVKILDEAQFFSCFRRNTLPAGRWQHAPRTATSVDLTDTTLETLDKQILQQLEQSSPKPTPEGKAEFQAARTVQ